VNRVFEKRIVDLNGRPVDPSGHCVMYWMQRSQRAFDNPALSFAIDLANDLSQPVAVYFGLFDEYTMGSVRAFKFMLEGLKETAAAFGQRGIGFVMRRERPWEGVVRAACELGACAVVVDEDYLNIGRAWRNEAARGLAVRFLQVDSETVVPARVCDHEEWGAYTLRPKILRALDECLVDRAEAEPRRRWRGAPESIDAAALDPLTLASSLHVEHSAEPTPYFRGGMQHANERLARFLERGLPRYGHERNEIGLSVSSELSPYLHFGQIASLRVALAVRDSDAPDDCVEAFLDQLIVRRELAINFCIYNSGYDTIDAAPKWAADTLEQHISDPRPDIYSTEELEFASTHDDLWNAAQTELVRFGKIHPYMRMVWAKKLLEWTPTPAEAMSRAIYLNDKYALDGRDPNGYANIAWCICGKHDRPFAERRIFGKVRYMSTDATKRKTRWRDYVDRVNASVSPAGQV